MENGARIEDVKDMLKHTMRIEYSEYGIRTLDVDSFLIFLCIHHYREATMLLKILEGEDLTLYKYLDIHVFIKQTSIDWAKLISKAKLYDKKLKCIIHYGIQSIYILELYLIHFFLCLS